MAVIVGAEREHCAQAPVAPIERPGELHLHLHGITAEDIARDPPPPGEQVNPVAGLRVPVGRRGSRDQR